LNELFGVAVLSVGGFIFIISAGSESRVRTGKRIMTTAVIGIVLVLSAWLIVNTILFFLTGQETGGIATIGDFMQPWNEIDCGVPTIICP